MCIDLYLVKSSTFYNLKPAKIENSRKLARIIILLLLLFMGSVLAAEILNLETYNKLNFLATNQKYQTELKKKQRLAEF